MELVLHPYPSHGTPRILEEMAMGKPEGQAMGQGGPHTSLVPLPRLLPGPPKGHTCERKGSRGLAQLWVQVCKEGIQTRGSMEQPRQWIQAV